MIHSYVVNDKIVNLLIFWPDSESFGKWCLEKCKNFFDTTTLMPAKSVPKVYYITHLCEMEQNNHNNLPNIIWLFENGWHWKKQMIILLYNRSEFPLWKITKTPKSITMMDIPKIPYFNYSVQPQELYTKLRENLI